MGKTSRTKGAKGEREFCKVLSEELDFLGVDSALSRNLSQTRDGGHDIAGLGQFAIEVKRAAVADVRSWWAQAVMQADDAGKFPVLAYRLDRRSWRVVMHINDITHPDFALSANDGHEFTVEIGLALFAQVVADRFKDQREAA